MAKKSEEKIIREFVDEKTGAKMEVVYKEATTMVKDGDKKVKKVVWSGEYARPVDLENGMIFDGEEKVNSLYQNERLTNFLDSKRRESGDSKKALMAQLLAALESGDVLKVVELMGKLGISQANMKAMITAAKEEEEEETEEEGE